LPYRRLLRYDIVFVHIGARFHMAEIGHAHHFGTGELD